MIINTELFIGNSDIQVFADFIRTSVQKKPNDWEWLILLECAHTPYPPRYLGPGNATDRVFSALVTDAAGDAGNGASLYPKSVCNAIAGWDGGSEEFSEKEIQQIFETVNYLREIWNDISVDTEKIYLRDRIPAISQIYHFCHITRWSVYDRHISTVLDRFAQDFAKVNPDAAARLGDQIRFPVPDETGRGEQDFLRNGDLAAIKFVQTSLLLRCLAENMNKNQVPGGPNFLRPDGTWNLTLAGMALSWMSEYRWRRKEKHMVDPDTPITGKWTLLE